jgi:UPF0271 protein
MPNDADLMPYVTSANIACGYHAGSEAIMHHTIDLAIKNSVAIGAHPGFNDKQNFGRIDLQLSVNEVYDLVTEQVLLLCKMCKEHNGNLHHVKPHGALYNMAAKNKALAAAIAKSIFDIDHKLILYGLSGSCLVDEGNKLKLRTANEVFADRTYQQDGSLTNRAKENALINDEQTAINQVLQMILQRNVTTVDGKQTPITADTLCIHGDGKHAVQFAKSINAQLKKYNIEIKTI